MKAKILVIGSEGFIGKSFTNYHKNDLKKEIYFVDLIDSDKGNYFKSDIAKFENIDKIISKVKPDEVYNFSGSFSNDFETDYLINVIGTKNILDSLLKSRLNDSKVLINGSAAEYGYINNLDYKVNEDYPLNPISVYGLAKVFQTTLSKFYFSRYNLRIYIARPFNIIGYGVSQRLFIGRLLNQIKNHLKDKANVILGNLQNERDYLDIEDLIRAYDCIMERGVPGEIYNIGSGVSTKIQDLLYLFLEVFEIEPNSVKQNDQFIKKLDIPKIIADNSKLKTLDWDWNVGLKKSVIRIKDELLNDIN